MKIVKEDTQDNTSLQSISDEIYSLQTESPEDNDSNIGTQLYDEDVEIPEVKEEEETTDNVVEVQKKPDKPKTKKPKFIKNPTLEDFQRAMDFIEDVFVYKALAQFFLLNKSLKGLVESNDPYKETKCIEIGIRDLEYRSVTKDIIDSVMPTPIKMLKDYTIYNIEGVKVKLYVVDGTKYYFNNLDTKVFNYTYLKIPNPPTAYFKDIEKNDA